MMTLHVSHDTWSQVMDAAAREMNLSERRQMKKLRHAITAALEKLKIKVEVRGG